MTAPHVTLYRIAMLLALGVLLLHDADRALAAEAHPRARDIGIPLAGTPGPLNAITDVAGIEVGHASVTGGDARTGVTALFPRGRDARGGVPAGMAVFNGAGEMTGAALIQELGVLYGPVLLTGTLGVGTARNGLLEWTRAHVDDPVLRASRMLPLIAETYDGGLSDAWSLPLQPQHVKAALDDARPGPVAEGSVGGGTGMVCYEFKCGIGTSSRVIPVSAVSLLPDNANDREDAADYVLGVLVQANFGNREQLTVAGLPAGKVLDDLRPERAAAPSGLEAGDGSLIVIIATDAPLLPTQLERLARRATIGMARTGSWGSTTSGDIFLAISTAEEVEFGSGRPSTHHSLANEMLDPLLEAAALATEEAILNALVAGRDMDGRGGSRVYGLPLTRLQALLKTSLHPQDAAPGREPGTDGTGDEPGRQIDMFLQESLETGPYPALAVSVQRGDDILYEAAHGWADLEHGVPATSDTVFRIGSITKSFTSLLIAQLVAEGALQLETPLGEILSDYGGPAREVPIRKLMNHTAGLPNYTELQDFPHGTRATLTSEQMLDFFRSEDLLHRPGLRLHYSNSGTFLLGLVIEQLTGLEWGEALRTRVLEPLELNRTDHGAWQPLVKGRARGYTPTPTGYANAPWLDVSVPFSAGSMTSTLADVQRYLRQVHVENFFGDEVRDILHRRERLASGERLDYTLGALIMRERLGRPMLGHPGAIDGFSSYMSLYPDDDVSIVVLANAPFGVPDPIAIEQRIARMVLGLPRPQPSGSELGAEQLAAIAGDYFPGSIRMGLPPLGVIIREGSPALQFGGTDVSGEPVPLLHVEGKRFMAAHDEAMKVTFEPAAGDAGRMLVDWYGAVLPYERQPAK